MDQGSILERTGAGQLQLIAGTVAAALRASTLPDPSASIRFRPVPSARRQSLVCAGVTAETVSMFGREPFECGYSGPHHLLVAHELLVRRRGVTAVEGLPDSMQQNLSHTLTFVPAGCSFREWHDPDIPFRSMYIHIDPHARSMAAADPVGTHRLAPRMHFQNPALWQTVLKLKAWVETYGDVCSSYGDALGVVLAHELLCSEVGASAAASNHGGLGVWQRRAVAQYVEDNLAEPIPIARLAALARLSPYHFSRTFRRSFGISPHRYHSYRRIERAKALLADPTRSVTQIGFELGFSESSNFTVVFRRLVGCTPTGYRRSLTTCLE